LTLLNRCGCGSQRGDRPAPTFPRRAEPSRVMLTRKLWNEMERVTPLENVTGPLWRSAPRRYGDQDRTRRRALRRRPAGEAAGGAPSLRLRDGSRRV
jgi:hypothetical protein